MKPPRARIAGANRTTPDTEGLMSVNRLPDVGRIQGVQGSGLGADPRLARISLQYTDERNCWHELQMPALDALYLLNLLAAWAKDSGMEKHRHPPGG